MDHPHRVLLCVRYDRCFDLQPPDDVTCLAWNRQVQHILASTYAGRCVVWDLRKNEPIIKVSDSMSRVCVTTPVFCELFRFKIG